MTTFCAIHGAFGDGVTWARVGEELSARGHRFVAPSLPCEDRACGLDAYADAVCAALGDADDVVLIGHSLGGATAVLVAARRPVREIVFVAALLPVAGRPLVERLPEMLVPGGLDPVVRGEDGLDHWPTLEAATDRLFHDASPESARWGWEHLRGQAGRPFREPSPAFPEVPSRYVRCAEDKIVGPFAEADVVLPGGHAPHVARPAELAAVVVG